MINTVKLTEAAWKIVIKSLYANTKQPSEAHLIGRYLHILLTEAKQQKQLPTNVIKLDNKQERN